MLSYLGHQAHDALLATTSSNELVGIHATRQPDGKINVLLINKDPSATYSVQVALRGVSAHGLARVYRYGIGSTSIARSSKQVRGTSFAISVGPYSLTTIQLP
jgi:hypothetical protein